MSKYSVLIGSPIRQKPEILKEFLLALSYLDNSDIQLDFIFIDDNDDPNSSVYLSEFEKNRTIVQNAKEIEMDSNPRDTYLCNDTTHYWKEQLVWRVSEFKNMMIKRAIDNEYDYLFLIDSDILLHPQTIRHLIDTGKDIISEIFWTAWTPGGQELPNVWLYDIYDMSRRSRGEVLSAEERVARQQSFLNQLKVAGVYEVGGLGACTLISRKALLTGVSFKEIKNLSFWGEDRHFCVRANALGLDLFVDTNFPAYHIFRESLLPGAVNFRTKYIETC